MQMKKIYAISVLITVFALAAASAGFAAYPDFKSVASTTDLVISFFTQQYDAGALGPAKHSKISKNNAPLRRRGYAYTKEAIYDGVELSMFCGNKKFLPGTVSIVEAKVFSKKWNLPGGLNVGMSYQQIKTLLAKDKDCEIDTHGPSHSSIACNGGDSSSDLNLGFLTGCMEFIFKNDLAAKITFGYNWAISQVM